MSDRYLWDRTGPPDPDVARLERELRPLAWRGRALDPRALPDQAGARPGSSDGVADEVVVASSRRRLAAAAAIVLAIGGATWWVSAGHNVSAPGAPPAVRAGPSSTDPSGPLYAVHALEGAPRVEPLDAVAAAGSPDRVRAGERVVCDARSRARLDIGSIGWVELDPGTRLRVERPVDEGERHRLHLELGGLTASIFAAPRLFRVGTPAGIAVDLGCEYTATVDVTGVTRLRVRSGMVSFEAPEREVTVPAGAECTALPGRGPGTPTWSDAPDAYREAVARLDASTFGTASAPPEAREPIDHDAFRHVLGQATPRDSLTLWNLLDHPDRSLRAAVYDRLAALAPPPDGVERDRCLEGDAAMRDAWKERLWEEQWVQ